MSEPANDLSLLSESDLQRMLRAAWGEIERLQRELRAVKASAERIELALIDRGHDRETRNPIRDM